MAPSSTQHKCGSKNRSHKCGLGLCSENTNTEGVILKKRICTKCGRSIEGHPLPKGTLCKLEPLSQLGDILLEKRVLRLTKQKENNKSDKALAKDRKRKELKEAMVKSKARSKLAKKYKKKKKEYIGWTALEEKNSVEKHNLPNMIEVCIDCGAKMFPWEKNKIKNDKAKTFSLCCM